MKPIDFVVQLPFSWRQRRARALREDMTKDRFLAVLANDAAEERAASLLWDKLVEVAVVPDFRPDPDDDLLYTYGLADEDLDEDIIVMIFSDLGYQLPPPPVLQRVGKISRPRDIIELVRQSARAA